MSLLLISQKMDAIYLKKSTITPINSSNSGFLAPSFSHPRRFTKLSFPRNSQKVLIFGSKDEAKVNQPEQLVLKEENPQLTLAKIIGRNSNSEVSNFEIEKLFYKKNGKSISSDIEEVPVDGIMERKLSNTLDGVDLVRPLAEKGVKFEVDDKSLLSSIKRPKLPVIKAVSSIRGSVPRVILRKPSAFTEDDDATGDLLKFKIQPNLSLVMGKEKGKERFSDITLVQKLEPSYDDKEHKCSITMNAKATGLVEKNHIRSESVPAIKSNNLTLPVNPELLSVDREQESGDDQDVSVVHGQQIDSVTGLQPLQQSGLWSLKKTFSSTGEPEARLVNTSDGEATLHKPTRVDQSVGGTSDVLGYETVVKIPNKNDCDIELEDLLTSTPINELEDRDWAIAEDLINTGGRDEVELISCSIRGFVVSFGSLIGFLPYRNLAPKYKYLAFETWLRLKGLDPSVYKQSLSIIGSCEDTSHAIALDSRSDLRSDHKDYREVSSNMELDELLTIYDKDKLRFLTSFLAQKFKVNVILADRKSRRLIFSVKPKEKEEAVEKKRNLMAKLSIGEVVTCCIKKITYFGIFVEVEGVTALIHQTEVSWDVTLNPTSCFRIGQFVEAKVHQLDFSLERIFLSLKEVEPDPLIESLEAVIGDHVPLSRELTSAEADTEWTDMENLLKELNKFEGIHSVSRGRYFLSPGLAPTFQVYMASMFENQYKLLARAGNRVQEVIVETSLDKEDMKSAILTCTNIVE